MVKIMRFFLIVVLILSHSASANAADADPRKIIDEMEQLYRGASSDIKMTMVVETPQYERKMQLTGQSLGKEYGFFRILSPRKDRGIATLKRDSEMWNYFPKINKVIKVPPSMMMGSWMGSDFTNDDLVKETQLIDSYEIVMVENDLEYLFTLTPTQQAVTVWGKIEYLVSKAPLLPLSQTFFDEDGEKIRVISFSEPKMFDGRMMPSVLEVRPINKDGYSTRIIYDDIIFDAENITAQTFSMRNLKARF